MVIVLISESCCRDLWNNSSQAFDSASGTYMGSPGYSSGKESACQCRGYKRQERDWWVGKIPWRRVWQPTPVFLSGKSHGQRRLAGYSLCGHKRVGHNLVTKQQQKFPSVPIFWRVFKIINRCLILWKTLSTSILIYFFVFNLLIFCISLIDLHMLKNPYIPGINSIWSCFSYFLRYNCIALNFPHRTAFAVFHRFWVVMFSLSLVYRYFLTSSLIS